jgi:hypothetical protein
MTAFSSSRTFGFDDVRMIRPILFPNPQCPTHIRPAYRVSTEIISIIICRTLILVTPKVLFSMKRSSKRCFNVVSLVLAIGSTCSLPTPSSMVMKICCCHQAQHFVALTMLRHLRIPCTTLYMLHTLCQCRSMLGRLSSQLVSEYF